MAETGRARAKAAIDRAILAANGGEETKAPAAWVFHDMRRAAATGLGIAPHVVKDSTRGAGRKSGRIKGVAAVYNRYNYAAKKREALDKWAVRVDCDRRGGRLMAKRTREMSISEWLAAQHGCRRRWRVWMSRAVGRQSRGYAR